MLEWYEHNRRDLPWRRTRDPYRILVSEIMLQQTRAEVVIPYYQRFLKRFPDAGTLAQAKEADVLACWSGLGYYSRARNLQAAARAITATEGFPRDYASLRALPGVGPYTAAAVSSIAFDQPCAVLDGNVLRVLARITNDSSDIASARTRAGFQRVADGLLAPECPGEFNQAMMELGATICLPRVPTCSFCPVAEFCEARKAGSIVGGTFLENFAGGLPWAHLDIAGSAWDLGRPYVGKGASGYGVRLLVALARSFAE